MQFVWAAVYEDGTISNQFNNGIERSTATLSRYGLRQFILYNGQQPVLFLQLRPGDCLIYRRRIELSAGSQRNLCHLIGKTWYYAGVLFQLYFAVLEPDAQVYKSDRLTNNDRWLYPVEDLPCDSMIVI